MLHVPRYVSLFGTAATRLAFSLSPSMLKATRTEAEKPTCPPKVIIITGPTAVGKSAAALRICQQLNGEIISADSVQLYKHLNIGSNKASQEEQNLVPHHLLDIADPAGDVFSAGHFFRIARASIEDVCNRGRLPVVVGGTMMYVRWLMYGRPATPAASEQTKIAVKEKLESFAGDWDAAVEWLSRKDPNRAAALSRNDWYRLGRASEVLETTGIAMTALPLKGGAPNTGHDSMRLDFDFRCLFLVGERIPLNRRIDERCEYMILPQVDASESVAWDEVCQRSILSEVSSLLILKKLRVGSSSPCLAIGYRQTVCYLISRALTYKQTEELSPSNSNDDISPDALNCFRNFVESFQAATRGYAKQQISWFRKERNFQWVEAGSTAIESIDKLIQFSKAEYDAFRKESEGEQVSMRDNMIAQGKLMKRYIGQRNWLKKDSMVELQAVQLAEKCAGDIADCFNKEELEQMLSVVIR